MGPEQTREVLEVLCWIGGAFIVYAILAFIDSLRGEKPQDLNKLHATFMRDYKQDC